MKIYHLKIFHLIVALGLGLGLTLSITLVFADDDGLDISKTAQPVSINAGESVTYTIQLNTNGNDGESDISGVTLTDTLPLSTTFSHWLTQPGGAINAGNTITWTGTVSSGVMLTLSFVVTHTGNTGESITNTAYYNYSIGNGSNEANFTVGQVVSSSNLSIDKSYLPSTVYAGDFVTYTITLDNGGASTSATITDTLPISTTFERLIFPPSGVLTSSQAVTWTGTIADEGQITLIFVVSQTGTTGDIITNTAYYDFFGGNDSDTIAFTVGGETLPPNLSIDKSHQPSTVYAGDFVTYTITLDNSGASTSATITDILPVSTTFERLAIDPGGVTTSSQAITWTGIVTDEVQIKLSFVVSQTGSTGDIITNTAYYTYSSGSDSNNTTFTVKPIPTLSMIKSNQPITVSVGNTVTYTITLSNSGGSDITNVTLTDTLPTSTTFNKWVINPGNVVMVSNTITWTGTVTDAEQITLSFVVSHTASAGDIITNTAYFSHTNTVSSTEAVFTVSADSSYRVYLPIILKN